MEYMLCQLCRKHPATICIASDLNGTKSQIYLCEECAKKYSLQQGNVSPEMILKLLSELSKNITAAVGGGPQIRPEDTDRTCSHCGRSYKDFVKTHLLGCPACYDQFRDLLEPIISQAQVIPAQGREEQEEKASENPEIALLTEMLEKCIAGEEYEQAAILRDRIDLLKKSGGDQDGMV